MEKRNSNKTEKMNKDSSYNAILDTFFSKSTPGKTSTQKKPKAHDILKRYLVSAFVLALALSAIIIIIYMKLVVTAPLINKGEYLEEIIKDGELNRNLIKEAYFDGDAVRKSSFLKNKIKLINYGKYGWAALMLVFEEPVNLEEKSLLITAKTKHGTKKANLILKDSVGRFVKFSDIPIRSDWSLKHIDLSEKDDFDLKTVTWMKIEFGNFSTKNPQNATIYIKDIVVRKGT